MILKLDKIINQIIVNKFFLYFFIIIFILSPQIKFLNLSLNIFDTGLYASNLYSIHYFNNLNGIFMGHFQPILLILSKIYLFTDKFSINALILLQSLCLISPVFFYKNSDKLKLVYLISFPLWYINYNGFHTDVFIVPLLFLLLNFKTNYKYIFLFSFILIKEIYILFAISYLFYEISLNNKKNNYLKIFFLIILSLVLILIFQSLNMSNNELTHGEYSKKFFDKNNIEFFFSLISINNLLSLKVFNKILILSLIFIPYLFLCFRYKIFYFLYLPIFFVYFLLDNINYLKPYFHYSSFLIPLLFFLCGNTIINSKSRFVFFVLVNFLFTVNLFNPIFYSKIKFAENYNYKNYINVSNYSKLDYFLEDINIPNNEPITVSNNLLHHKIVNRNIILIIDYTEDIIDSKTACVNLNSKKLNIIEKKLCNIRAKYIILNKYDYNKYKKKINTFDNYEIIKENNDYIFIKSKNT